MKKSTKKLLIIFVYIYNLVSTYYERFFLKIKKKSLVSYNNDLLNKGYEILKLKDFIKIDYPADIIQKNKYLQKIIFKDENLKKMIKNIFINNEICGAITNKTGYKYSIDYFTAYITSHISLSDSDKGWYANHWHTDKPFSQNMIKVIVPLHDINCEHGPMEILLDNKNKIQCLLKKDEVLVFFPNKCLHRAGNPDYNFERKLMMFQLNPSKEWVVNQNIFIRQGLAEPKFPIINYFGNRKVQLKTT